MSNRFEIPTEAEIEMAYRTMLPDLAEQKTADRMGRLAAANPMFQFQVRKMLESAVVSAKLGSMNAAAALEAVVGGAMMYGLHLGIHIGLARRTRENVQ